MFVEYAQTLDLEVNAAAQALAARVRARAVEWLSDIVPTLGGVALFPDFGHASLPAKPFEAIQALVAQCLDDTGLPAELPVRLIEVPVCYEPEFALDLAQLAAQVKLTVDAVIRLHTAPEYRVLMMGFVPGHAYLGGLDERLSVPRRDSPRAQVPAGSIAIANGQAVIYPFQTPGGWSIIGRTPMRLFDAYREPPCVFAPQDRVRFVAISAAQFRAFKDDESSFTRTAAQR